MRRQPNDSAAVVLAAAEAVTLDELARDVPDRVARLVGASGAMLYRYDGVRPEPLGGTISGVLDQYGPELAREDPTQLRAITLAPQPRVVLATRAVGRRAFERCAAYSDFYRSHDIERITCVWLNDRPYATPGMVGLFLVRDRRRDEFGVDEGVQLRGVLAGLATAVRRCERVDSIRWRHDGLEAAAEVIGRGAYVVLDHAGHVLWQSRAAGALFADRPIPPVLVAEAQRLLATVAGDAAPPRLSCSIDLGDGATLRAELQLSGATPGRRVVVAHLERTGGTIAATAIAPLRERYGLTAAEARVLRLVALGLSNAAIAKRSEVSIETVRTHVARVLAKLGVATRAQAGLAVWSFEARDDDGSC